MQPQIGHYGQSRIDSEPGISRDRVTARETNSMANRRRTQAAQATVERRDVCWRTKLDCTPDVPACDTRIAGLKHSKGTNQTATVQE
jgi:hypothetical protein